ncbi:conserved exported protein of unknown function [Sterolibacterium denitrificans]|uniref:ABC transporter substrate-binding protein n=1 Tax=Sterolibacterium denitrificans TaxID=157592 RepID=A0A7Z7HPP9_9PROT|nr:ABC transporter substrate binding protein [Sterolibacterium denitrificans]SMB22131.1 conserved exported protein of unknown function [Sterolibacterium denitrificans]
MRRRLVFGVLLLTATTGLPLSPLALALAAPQAPDERNSPAAGIAVVYPDLREPYRSVFSRIIEGVELQARVRVTGIPVGAGQSAADLAGELRRQEVRSVIALGRNGLKAIKSAGGIPDIGIVVGGVVSVPEAEIRGMSVHSLAPDPLLLFERLRNMAPGTRRIYVAYEPGQNAWLMRLAREAARNLGLELITQETADVKSALRFYRDAMGSMDPRRDALWLPQDSVAAEESVVLPRVLQEAWGRNLLVFSSSVMHVKRGALFALYPDNLQLGRRLASSALAALAGSQTERGMTPLREVLVAVNIRTASHLGLAINSNQQNFDLVFPEP